MITESVLGYKSTVFRWDYRLRQGWDKVFLGKYKALGIQVEPSTAAAGESIRINQTQREQAIWYACILQWFKMVYIVRKCLQWQGSIGSDLRCWNTWKVVSLNPTTAKLLLLARPMSKALHCSKNKINSIKMSAKYHQQLSLERPGEQQQYLSMPMTSPDLHISN